VDIALKELGNALWKRVMRKELMEKGNKDNGFYFEKKVNETFSS